MEKYIQVRDGLNDKGHLVLEKNLKIDNYKVLFGNKEETDMYSSLFWFPKEAKDYVDSNDGSIRGYNGPAYSNRLFFDLDSKEDINIAKKDAVNLLIRLGEVGVSLEKEIKIYFSGNKGFHVEVPIEATLTVEEMKNLCCGIATDLESFDDVIYNTSRIIRIPNTKHQVSGLYKVQLEPDDLISYTVEEIKEIAKVKHPLKEATPVKNTAIFNKFKKPTFSKPVSVIVSSEEVDGIRGLDSVDFTQCPKNKPRCIFALEHGVMVPGLGERSELYLRLASYYRNQGMAKEVAYSALKGIARLNAGLYPDSEPFTKEELFNTSVNSAYSKSWKQIPGAFGSDPKNDLIKKYCDAVGKFTNKPCCVHHEVQALNTVVQIGDVSDDFDKFASNFDKNVVKTGIEFIDRNMQITTGTTNLIVGAAGCHRKGEKVLMYDGTIKKVEDIKIGELLMGPDSKPREVTQLYSGKDRIYKVELGSGNPVFYNSKHTLVYYDRGNKVEMNIEEYISKYKNYNNFNHNFYMKRKKVEFHDNINKTLPIDPYFLGLWLGDGTKSELKVTSINEDIKNFMYSYAKELGGKIVTYDKKPSEAKDYKIVFAEKRNKSVLYKEFVALNLINNKHIPHIFKTSSRENRLKLLAGVIDTDGSRNRNSFHITQKKENIIDDLQYVARSLGFSANKISYIKNNRTYFVLSISGEISLIPCKTYKKTNTNSHTNPENTKFKISDEIIEDEYFGFTVSNDNLYLDGNFLLTRNCGKTALSLNVLNSANSNNQSSIFFSMDTHKNLIYLKLAMKHTNYSKDQIFQFHKENNKIKIEEIKNIISEAYKYTHFDFSTTLTLDQIRDKIFDVEQKTGQKIKFSLIDYAGRIHGPHSDVYANSNYNALKSVEVANITDTAMVILSQISRQTGDGSTPIRTKRAAKESGTWEESATNVITMWRPFMGDINRDSVIRMFLAKNRMGSELEQVLFWDGAKAMIRDMSFEELEEYKSTIGDKAEREYLKAKTGRIIQID